MNRSGSIDPASPFFSSIASQHAAKQEKDKEKKIKQKKFEQILDKEQHKLQSFTKLFPERFKDLSRDKIIEILLDDVHSCGDALKERQIPDTILDYKKAVRAFVSFVVDQSFEVQEKASNGNILKRKMFTQIQIIDEKLEQMATQILLNQKKQIEILAKLEEINGLLVNLLS